MATCIFCSGTQENPRNRSDYSPIGQKPGAFFSCLGQQGLALRYIQRSNLVGLAVFLIESLFEGVLCFTSCIPA